MEMPLGLGRTGEGYILGSDYVPLSALRFKADADFAAMRTEGARLALESKVRGYGFYRDYRGVPVIGVYGWLPALEMALIVEQDQAEVFGPAYATLARNLIVAMIAVLLATVAAYSVARGIARPLRTLSEAAARIADGDLDCRAAVGRRDEIGKLAASFNLMTGKLRDLIGQLHEELAERKRAEEELAASKRLLQDIADNSTSLIYVLDSEGRFLMVNRQLESLLGMTREALVGRPREAVLPAETAAMHEAHDLAVIAEGRPMMFEEPNVEPDGVHTYLTVKFPMIDAQGHIYGIGGISTDITERQRSEERIRKSLAEKETLLRELYHRTKNNMGVIIALLDMQSMETENEELRAAFADTQDRIRAMALVHQKLYEAKDLSHINLKEYLGDLSALLAESLGSRPGGLAIVPDLEDAFVLIDSAIPCGLIVNELISNAQKHAFPDGRPGRISIRLRRSEAGAIRLDVSDDGVGFPRGFDPKRDGRMGLKTVFALAESQLRGEIGFETGDGVSWRVLFRDDLYGTRV